MNIITGQKNGQCGHVTLGSYRKFRRNPAGSFQERTRLRVNPS